MPGSRPWPEGADLQCGKVNEDMTVQSAGPHQSRVQNVRSIGGRQHNDVVCGAHP